MEFPRHLHKPGGYHVIVANDAEYDEMKGRGWTDLPKGHVEQPKEVTLWDARHGVPADVTTPDAPPAAIGITDLTIDDAESLIADADADQLALMRAEEVAGKNRKGVLALIDVREADLLED